MSTHILFVDDEPPIRETLSLYFRRKGFSVTTASNSREAMVLLDATRFDLAIVDVNLGGENGLVLVAAIKRSQTNLPVIVFTSELEDEVLVRARGAGANAVLRKTGSLVNLFNEVCKHVPKAVC